MNDIINLLDLEDENIFVSDIKIDGIDKIITLETRPNKHNCPICGYIMHSKGIKSRTIKHPILQDGYKLTLNLKQRRWKCINPTCEYDMQEKFNFVDKSKRITNATELLVVLAFRDLNKTAEEIGREFHISGHTATDIFNKYVHPKRKVLPEILSVDEVYLDMDKDCKYALVLQDFKTGEPVDIVISRRKEYTLPYFSKIPPSERNNVKYLISDMYNPYIDYVNQYFPSAVSIVDSFHVMQWIIHKIDLYIIKLIKQFKARDYERMKNQSKNGRIPEKIPFSDEVYLLEKHKWVVLKNKDNIDYSTSSQYNRHFKMYMSQYAIESKFLSIDPNLEALRELKEKYVNFNKTCFNNMESASEELDILIEEYSHCNQPIFVEFSKLLKKYFNSIVNSFRYFEKINTNGEHVITRLSNGPIESLNRKAKDLKRNSRGYTNFEHLRRRFLFSNRNELPLNP